MIQIFAQLATWTACLIDDIKGRVDIFLKLPSVFFPNFHRKGFGWFELIIRLVTNTKYLQTDIKCVAKLIYSTNQLDEQIDYPETRCVISFSNKNSHSWFTLNRSLNFLPILILRNFAFDFSLFRKNQLCLYIYRKTWSQNSFQPCWILLHSN